MLNHTVGLITGNDDMIEDQYANPVQQALKLDCGGNVLRGWGTGTTGVIVTE